ncbi:hypothetical protein M0802_005146 [Mischocyttarus mexicanus]|nr:hypothetical protein M0802_005146 [Mischocyttarus mexicanus]
MKAAVTTSSTSARSSGDVAIPINITLSSVIFYPSPTYITTCGGDSGSGSGSGDSDGAGGGGSGVNKGRSGLKHKAVVQPNEVKESLLNLIFGNGSWSESPMLLQLLHPLLLLLLLLHLLKIQ